MLKELGAQKGAKAEEEPNIKEIQKVYTAGIGRHTGGGTSSGGGKSSGTYQRGQSRNTSRQWRRKRQQRSHGRSRCQAKSHLGIAIRSRGPLHQLTQ